MSAFEATLAFAQQLDSEDVIADLRENFLFPSSIENKPVNYLCGHSLGLQPKNAAKYIHEELEQWATKGVMAHFNAPNPWFSYHELLQTSMADIVGANTNEVVTMNSLTVNLHLMMVSFYRPTAKRFKILIEADTFPSDRYALESQIRFHGYDPQDALLEYKGSDIDELKSYIADYGDEIAVIWFGGVNYLTGQAFDMEQITKAGHEKGCMVGFDLAHAAGNLLLKLHDWQVDFAVWCCYKYLNGGPGTVGACYIHESHLEKDLPRFEGWWGHDKSSRFNMPEKYKAIPTIEAWQLSNPPIFQLAALRASLEIFAKVGMQQLRNKSELLSEYLIFLLKDIPEIEILSPLDKKQRGCQISMRLKSAQEGILGELEAKGVYCDFRKPNVLRVTAIPLYNRFIDVFNFVGVLRELL